MKKILEYKIKKMEKEDAANYVEFVLYIYSAFFLLVGLMCLIFNAIVDKTGYLNFMHEGDKIITYGIQIFLLMIWIQIFNLLRSIKK